MDGQKTETQWSQMFFINPAQKPHSTPACSALISSCFYRLLFFCLNCAVRQISLSSFSSGPLSLHILSVSRHHSSRCPPGPCPCWGGSLQSPLERGAIPPCACLALPGHTSLLLEDDQGCLSSKLQGKPGHRETGQQPKPTLGVCTNRSGSEPGLPGAQGETPPRANVKHEVRRTKKQASFSDDLKQDLVGVSLLSVSSENPGSQ